MKKIIMAIASVSLLCACGTIFSSGKQELAFDSNIADTEIYINGQKICSTPCITNIERGNKKLLIKIDYLTCNRFFIFFCLFQACIAGQGVLY